MKVRFAKRKDLRDIFNLYSGENNLNGDDEHTYIFNDIKDYFNKDVNKFLVCEEDKKRIIGVLLMQVFKRYIYLHTLVVHKDFRKQGVGSTLLKAMQDYAKSKNIFLIELITENNNNAMQGLLSKLDYKKGKDFIFYSKTL